jgi:hypothetical protein
MQALAVNASQSGAAGLKLKNAAQPNAKTVQGDMHAKRPAAR